MNKEQREIIIQRNLKIRNTIENKFTRSIAKVLIAQFREASYVLQLRGIDALRNSISRVLIDTRIGEEIRNLYAYAGLYYAKYTYRMIQDSARQSEKAGQISFSEQWVREILDYFKMYLIDKAVNPITITSKKIISDILDQGTREGWSIERMAKELENPLQQMYRARLVVRTETAKAAFYGRQLANRDCGFETEREWISVHDRRTRHGHRDVDGMVVDATQYFPVPVYKHNFIVRTENLRGPGDPEASAENICNCRCTEAYQAKRDERGRIIRKPISRVTVIQPGNFVKPTQTITI